MPITVLEAFRAKVPVFGSVDSEIEELLTVEDHYLINFTDELVQNVVDVSGLRFKNL